MVNFSIHFGHTSEGWISPEAFNFLHKTTGDGRPYALVISPINAILSTEEIEHAIRASNAFYGQRCEVMVWTGKELHHAGVNIVGANFIRMYYIFYPIGVN